MELQPELGTDALYISLSDAPVARTRSVGDNAAVDLDASGGLVGIEVISVTHPWPLARILDDHKIPAGEEAQIRVYFGLPYYGEQGSPEPPTLRIGSPAPALIPA